MLERMWRKGNPFTLLVGIQVGAASLEDSVEIPQEIKIELPYDPAIALLGIYPKDTNVVKRRAIYIPMFMAAIATIARLWKEPRCPSTNEWIKKMQLIYAMKYYSAIRKDEYPTFQSTWVRQEEIMLSEISQAEKVSYHMVLLICGNKE